MYSSKDPAFVGLLRRSILLPVILMLLIVAVLSWLLQVTSTQASSINKGLVAIAQAERVMALVTDFGDSWANYKVTGNKSFLQAFNDDRSKISSGLERLRALSGTTPVSAAREGQIENDLKDWLSAQTLVPPALDSGPRSWRLLVNLKLNQVRGDVGSLIAEERDNDRGSTCGDSCSGGSSSTMVDNTGDMLEEPIVRNVTKHEYAFWNT